MASSSNDPGTRQLPTRLLPKIYFYKKNEKYGFLSQFYNSGFEDPQFPGIYFPTAEHYMHYNKAILMGDKKTAQEILAIKGTQPSAAFFAGKKVKPFNSELWNEKKLHIVYRGNWLKFTAPGAEGIRQSLMDLKDHFLVECNPKDRIWGIGFTEEESKVVSAKKWGENNLGMLLMAVRNNRIKEAESRVSVTSQQTEGDKDNDRKDEDDKEVTDTSDEEESLNKKGSQPLGLPFADDDSDNEEPEHAANEDLEQYFSEWSGFEEDVSSIGSDHGDEEGDLSEWEGIKEQANENLHYELEDEEHVAQEYAADMNQSKDQADEEEEGSEYEEPGPSSKRKRQSKKKVTAKVAAGGKKKKMRVLGVIVCVAKI